MIQTLFGSVEQEPSLLEKLKSGVQKTRAGLVTALEDALQGKKQIDADLLDELESTLISADIGGDKGGLQFIEQIGVNLFFALQGVFEGGDQSGARLLHAALELFQKAGFLLDTAE